MDAQEAMDKLMEGNARFVKGERKEYDFPARRQELLSGQHPFATVIACSDSRVVPEFIFDVTMGEIFKIETAGNILDAVGLGSVEYGVEHLHTPILMVLGHSRCGAVTACCGCKGEGEGNLGKIMGQIKPAGEKAQWDVDSAILENLNCVKECMLKESPIVKELSESGKVRIVLAKYELETGEVKVLG